MSSVTQSPANRHTFTLPRSPIYYFCFIWSIQGLSLCFLVRLKSCFVPGRRSLVLGCWSWWSLGCGRGWGHSWCGLQSVWGLSLYNLCSLYASLRRVLFLRMSDCLGGHDCRKAWWRWRCCVWTGWCLGRWCLCSLPAFLSSNLYQSARWSLIVLICHNCWSRPGLDNGCQVVLENDSEVKHQPPAYSHHYSGSGSRWVMPAFVRFWLHLLRSMTLCCGH